MMQRRKLAFSFLSALTLALPACFDGEFGELPDIPELPDSEKPGSEDKLPTPELHCRRLCETAGRCGGEGLPDGMESCLEECGIWLETMATNVPHENCFALEVKATSCVLDRNSCEDWLKWLDWIDDEALETPAPFCGAETRAVNERCWLVAE